MELPDIAFTRTGKLQRSAKSVEPKNASSKGKTDQLKSDKVLQATPDSGLIPESMASRLRSMSSSLSGVKSRVRTFRLNRYEEQSANARQKLAENEGPRNQQFVKTVSRSAQALNNAESRRAALTLAQKIIGHPDDDIIYHDLNLQNQRINKITGVLGPFHHKLARNVLDGYIKQEESVLEPYTSPNVKTYIRAAKQSAGISKEGAKFIKLDNATVKAQQALERSQAKIQKLRTNQPMNGGVEAPEVIGSIVDDPIGAINDTSYLVKGEEDHSLKKPGLFKNSIESQQAVRNQLADQLTEKFTRQHDEALEALVARNQQQQAMVCEGVNAGIEATYAQLKTLNFSDVKKIASGGLTLDDLENAAVDMSKHVGNVTQLSTATNMIVAEANLREKMAAYSQTRMKLKSILKAEYLEKMSQQSTINAGVLEQYAKATAEELLPKNRLLNPSDPKFNPYDLEADVLPFIPTSISAAIRRVRNPELHANSISGEFEPNSGDILLPPPKSLAEREAESRMYDEMIENMHIPGSFPSDG